MLEPPLASPALVLPSAIPVPTASPDLGLGSQACAEGGYLESKDTENENYYKNENDNKYRKRERERE